MKKQSRTLPLRAPHWKYDLPSPNESTLTGSRLDLIKNSPNSIDAIYLEMPRSTILIRGVVSIGATLPVIASGCMLAYLMNMIFFRNLSPAIGFTLASLGGIILMCWIFVPYIILDIKLPRDEPLRFNRARRKVYIYQFEHDRLLIFSRSRWGVRPVVHDWDNIVAEVCAVYAPGHGGLIENVYIAVRKPDTEEVIARYFFAHDIVEGKKAWDVVRLYMQQGPQSLPDFVHPPHDWSNDSEISPIRRFAPKVQWPIEMDLESRSAPSVRENQ